MSKADDMSIKEAIETVLAELEKVKSEKEILKNYLSDIFKKEDKTSEFISKDKVREKIEELHEEMRIGILKGWGNEELSKIHYKLQALEELLKEG